MYKIGYKHVATSDNCMTMYHKSNWDAKCLQVGPQKSGMLKPNWNCPKGPAQMSSSAFWRENSFRESKLFLFGAVDGQLSG